MTTNIRLMIFGLSRNTSRQELQALVQPCGDSRLALLDVPGDKDQAMAIVRLGADHRLGARLTERLQHHHVNGRRLQAWLTALPWA
jgi:hypothetical protein